MIVQELLLGILVQQSVVNQIVNLQHVVIVNFNLENNAI